MLKLKFENENDNCVPSATYPKFISSQYVFDIVGVKEMLALPYNSQIK